jgi:hypothetical protein
MRGNRTNHARGEDNGNASLTNAQVAEARDAFAGRKRTVRKLASLLKTSRSVLYRAIKGETYPDAGGLPAKPRHMPMCGEAHGRAILTKEKVVEMRTFFAKPGVTIAETALHFGHPFGTVAAILRFVTWPDAGGPRRRKVERRDKMSDDADVVLLRHLFWEDKVSGIELAQRFKITRSYVSLLVNGRLRRDAGGPMPPPGYLPMRGENNPASKLTDAERAVIGRRSAAGETKAALSREFKVTTGTIRDVLSQIPRQWEDMVKLGGRGDRPEVLGVPVAVLSKKQHRVIEELIKAGRGGLSRTQLRDNSDVGAAEKVLQALCDRVAAWRRVIRCPDEDGRYRVAT